MAIPISPRVSTEALPTAPLPAQVATVVPLDSAVGQFLKPLSRQYKDEFQTWDQELRTIFKAHCKDLPVNRKILTHDLLLLLKCFTAHYSPAAELLTLAYSFYGLGLQDRDELDVEFQELDPNAEEPLLDRTYFDALLLPPCVLARQRFPAVFAPDQAKVL